MALSTRRSSLLTMIYNWKVCDNDDGEVISFSLCLSLSLSWRCFGSSSFTEDYCQNLCPVLKFTQGLVGEHLFQSRQSVVDKNGL